MDMTAVRIEKVMLSGDKITQIWLGFIALGWPCNVTDVGGGHHSIEVKMPVGQSATPQASRLFQQLGGIA